VNQELIIELDESAGPYASFAATYWLVEMANECGLPVAKNILGNRVIARPGDCAHGIYAKQVSKLPPHCSCCKDKPQA
jgi:hypothetical protein